MRDMGRKPKARRDQYGAWLHHLRMQAGLTQDDLAEKSGLPQTTIAHWERTGNLPGRQKILQLAEALGISLEKLLRTDRPVLNPGRKTTRPSARARAEMGK